MGVEVWRLSPLCSHFQGFAPTEAAVPVSNELQPHLLLDCRVILGWNSVCAREAPRVVFDLSPTKSPSRSLTYPGLDNEFLAECKLLPSVLLDFVGFYSGSALCSTPLEHNFSYFKAAQARLRLAPLFLLRKLKESFQFGTF